MRISSSVEFHSLSVIDPATGLVSDDQALHEERLKLWNEFNTCWLAVLQRQKDDTQQMLDTGRSPTAPQSLLQEEFLENMGSELVRLCDGMEKYGLVDYQMGVWEEEIISSTSTGLLQYQKLPCLHRLIPRQF